MANTHLTAIIGGIGAGKSVVSNILRAMGYDVYDCDAHAKTIIDTDAALRKAIADATSPNVLFADGSLNRPALAAIVFNDAQKLAALNALVHGAVRTDIELWSSANAGKHLFIETAILYQSHLDRMVNDVWEVQAPEDVRIARVMARNNISAEQVQQRIAAQTFTPDVPHPCIHTITNTDTTPLLPQILSLLKSL
jgi:dephospho-CoA kinase